MSGGDVKRDFKFWINDPFQLISDFNLSFKDGSGRELSKPEKLNVITRYIIILFLIFVLIGSAGGPINFEYSLIFLLTGLLCVVILANCGNGGGNNGGGENTKEGFSDEKCYYLSKAQLDELTRRKSIKENYSDINLNNPSYNKMSNNERVFNEPTLDGQSWNPNYHNSIDQRINVANLNKTPIKGYDITNSIAYSNKAGQMWEYSNEDLYQEGVSYSPTYSAIDPKDDGGCCKMANPRGQQVRGGQKPVEYGSGMKYFTPKMGVNPRQLTVMPELAPRIFEQKYWEYPSSNTSMLNEGKIRDYTNVPMEDQMLKRGRIDTKKDKYSLLMQETPTCTFTEEEMMKPENRLFLQTIEPNVYSYQNLQNPINYNLGITETPQNPPPVKDQLCNPYANYPLYSRIDPQLIRDDVLNGRGPQPKRAPWSEKYSDFEAAPGSINVEDIYDGRWASSGGGAYRDYTSVDLGQTSFYYSDIDPYRANPSFTIRSKIDHIEYVTPDGAVQPYYLRAESLEDIREQVEDQFTADTITMRESLMESQMRKRNSELWQLRYAPLSRQANQRTMTIS